MTDAERLADAILRAAGSGLRNYTRPEPIIAAAQAGIDEELERAAQINEEQSSALSGETKVHEHPTQGAFRRVMAEWHLRVAAEIRAMKGQNDD